MYVYKSTERIQGPNSDPIMNSYLDSTICLIIVIKMVTKAFVYSSFTYGTRSLFRFHQNYIRGMDVFEEKIKFWCCYFSDPNQFEISASKVLDPDPIFGFETLVFRCRCVYQKMYSRAF